MTLPSPSPDLEAPESLRQGLASQLYLFAHALRLSWRAQKIQRGVPLAQLVARLTRSRLLPRAVAPEHAWRSTVRASRRLKRYVTGLDTCLIRSLVAGTLLSDQPNVCLHIGVKRSANESDPLRGHSWVTLGERVIPERSDRDEGGKPYREILTLPLERRR